MTRNRKQREHPHASTAGAPGASSPGEPGYDGAATVGDDGAAAGPLSFQDPFGRPDTSPWIADDADAEDQDQPPEQATNDAP